MLQHAVLINSKALLTSLFRHFFFQKNPASDNFLEIISSKSKITLNLETHCIALRIYFILKKIELTLQWVFSWFSSNLFLKNTSNQDLQSSCCWFSVFSQAFFLISLFIFTSWMRGSGSFIACSWVCVMTWWLHH